MPFKKGVKRPDTAGRRSGVPNVATANAREAIAAFVDGNAPRLQGWLDQIAATDGPAAAFRCVMDLLEYHVPKLARMELTGKDGAAVSTTVTHIYEQLPPKEPALQLPPKPDAP